MSSEYIQSCVYNTDNVIEKLNVFPQTYKTILKQMCDDSTCQFILRRKINILLKQGKIYKSYIPGTRFGECLFYIVPKKYNIIIESGRAGSNVFCFFSYKKINKFYIETFDCYKLEGYYWMPEEDKIFFDGSVLKWI
jgi:hypothetical protein